MNLKKIFKYLYRRPQHLIIHFLSKIQAKHLDTEQWNKILIIAPHPDDEIFGCAGLIEQLTSKRKFVNILFLSRGEAAVNDINKRSKIIKKRRELAEEATGIFGLDSDSISWLDFPDGKFVNISKKEQQHLETHILNYNPDVVFYPHHWDGSPDHITASIMIYNIVKQHNIEGYEYCVWLWHHMATYKAFLLNYRSSYLLPVSDINKKTKAVRLYADAVDESGIYYSGKLPEMFLKAVTWNRELFFKS